MYSTFQSYILNSEKDISHMLVFSLREQHWELGPSTGAIFQGFFYRQFPFSSSSFSKKIAERRSKNRALRSFFSFFSEPHFSPRCPRQATAQQQREFTPPQQFGFSPPPFSRLRRRERSRDEPNVASPSSSLSISGHLFSRFLHSGRGAISHPPPCLHPTTTYRN